MSVICAVSTEAMILPALAAIFVMVFIVSLKSLKEFSLFSGPVAAVIAVCVSLLSVIGLTRAFSSERSPGAAEGVDTVSPELNFILLAYAALAVAVVILFLLWVFAKLFGHEKKSPRHLRRLDGLDMFKGLVKRLEEPSDERSIRK